MTDELQTGDTLGTYWLGERLGGGGFGAVWKATDRATGRVVALKTLRTDVYSLDTMKLRSEVELLAGSASSVSKHVVKVLGGGVEPRPYVVMEYVDGVDLGRELERRRRIPQRETIRIGREVAEALAALKDVGIIHRDVKPSNIMIDLDGVTKLTDFGIAKIVGFDTITATSQMPMTQAYAAPEVWEGKASHRSDLYALGCVLFQCLAGRPPFTGSIAELYRGHSTKEPDWTLLPEGTVQSLRDLLRACLAKAEEDRPSDAREVETLLGVAEEELSARLAGPSATDLPVHEPQAFGPWLRRDKHPTQDWAFLCIHETTGEKATVEIHFADDIEYGARLRKAVEVNPKLIPHGAERLLGTNRLVLRPGEAWTTTPPGQFQFWVAREELPLRPGVAVLDEAGLHTTATLLSVLLQAATASGLDLLLEPECLHLMTNGAIILRRPGLAVRGDDGMAWLRSLPLAEPARAAAESARDLNTLTSATLSQAGVAQVPSQVFPTERITVKTARLPVELSESVDEVNASTSPTGSPSEGVRVGTNGESRPPATPDIANRTPSRSDGVGPAVDSTNFGKRVPQLKRRLAVAMGLLAAILVGTSLVAWGIVEVGTSNSREDMRDHSAVPVRDATVGIGATPSPAISSGIESPSRSSDGVAVLASTTEPTASPAMNALVTYTATFTQVPATAVPTAAVPTSTQSGGVFADDFSSAATGLMVAYVGDGRSVQYSNGSLILEQSTPSERVGAGSKSQFGNAVTEFDIAFVGSPAQLVVAADCRSQGSAPGAYGVRVDVANRTFKLVVGRSDGSYFDATPVTVNNAINVSGANHVRLSCIGDRIAASVNGSTEISTTDSNWKSGWFQITIQNFRLMPDVRAAMDNLKITLQ